MNTLITAAAIALAASSASAMDIPRYDPPAYCGSVADRIGGSASLKQTCLRSEQQAYDELKPQWGDIPADIAERCDQMAQTIGGTYRMLATCIRREAQAAATTPEFRF